MALICCEPGSTLPKKLKIENQLQVQDDYVANINALLYQNVRGFSVVEECGKVFVKLNANDMEDNV